MTLVPAVRRAEPYAVARYDSPFGHVLDPAWARLESSTAAGYRFGDRVYEFADIGRLARGYAAAVLDAGVDIGEPVVVCGPPSPEWVGAAFGILAAGGALSPLDPSLTEAELSRIVDRLGARVQVIVPGGPPRLGLRPVVPADPPVGEGLPRRGSSEDVAVILHTSGSTGLPKAVELTHDNLVQSLHSFVDVFGCTERDRTCIAVPLFHVTGLVDQLLQMLWLGGTCRLLEHFSTDAMIESLVADDITVMFAVPAVFALLVRRPPRKQLALRLAIYGGSPIGRPTIDALLRLIPGVRPVQGYGMTEMTSLATALPFDMLLDAPMSVGVPSPITDLRVVGDDGGECEPGDMGEIIMRGPHRTRGYRGDAAATAAAIDKHGWLHSGDLGWYDERGLLFLAGRRGEIINRGGEKISPREVESVLCDLDCVAEAVVFSIPDDVLFEAPVAAVVVERERPFERDEVEAALNANLARFKHPVAIIQLDAIPLGANGKPDVVALRTLIAESAHK